MNWTNQKPNYQHYIELIEIAIGYAQRNVNFPKIYGKNLKLCKYHESILTKNGYRFPFNYSNFQLIKKHRSTKSLSFFSAKWFALFHIQVSYRRMNVVMLTISLRIWLFVHNMFCWLLKWALDLDAVHQCETHLKVIRNYDDKEEN